MILGVIGFFIGNLSLLFFSELPNLLNVFLITAICTIVGITLKKRSFKTVILAAVLGFLWVLLHAKSTLDHRIPPHLESTLIRLVGTISSVPERKDSDLHFDLNVKTTVPKTLGLYSGRIKLRWMDPPLGIRVGDEWEFTVKLKQPYSFSNPGCFDFERHSFQKKILAEGYISDKIPPKKISSHWWSQPVDRIRMWISEKINSALAGRPHAGIIKALVIGLQNDISDEHWKVLRNTGTAHLVAISGMHIGLVACFTYMVVNLVWQRFPIAVFTIPTRLVTALGGLIAAILYSLLAGFTVPTQRSVIMISSFVIGILSKRILSVWRSYCLALGIVLLFDPFAPLSIGFWLSFSAVGILLYGMQGRLRPRGLWWRWGRAQWILYLGLAPITLAFFGTASFISPITNIIAIPWVTLSVVPLSLLGTMGLVLNEQLGTLILNCAEYLLELLWLLLNMCAKIPHAVWVNLFQTNFTLACSIIGVLFWLLPRGFPARFLGLIWVLPILLLRPESVAINTAKVTVLDVGQGLATIVATKNHVLIFDTGPKFSPTFDTGERVVLPYLATQGRKLVDILMISHGDNDHVGGADSILKGTTVKKIITSEPELFPGLEPNVCLANQKWEWDGVSFEILHPSPIPLRKRNDHSCVLRVVAGQQSMLLTADIEAKSEKILLNTQRDKLPATVLLVPHHGSKTSSTLEFIQVIHPQYAIVTFGYRNQYGHPKPIIVARYQQEKIPLLDTVTGGAISFTLDPNQKTPIFSSYRKEHKRFWHSQ